MKNIEKRICRLSWLIICLAGTSLASAQSTAEQNPNNAKRIARPYQNLVIPELLTGSEFNLTLHKSQKSFWEGATTHTYAWNREQFWGPTLLLNKGETIKLHVKNELDEPTTTHWHGLHLPASVDGGPHQGIRPGETWSPSFTVMNNAGTYWYHPHPHGETQKQITMGAGGFIIVKDSEESALSLPRTYGVDDIPLSLTSRRFFKNNEMSSLGDNDKYGDFQFANGVLDAQVKLPRQLVRLRLLNMEIERGYILGFRDNRTFYQIATDGGLIDKPLALKRVTLMPGERTEILVDLSSDPVGSGVDLRAFNSDQPFGFPGGENGLGRPNGSYLNNRDFNVLHVVVGDRTSSPVLQIPAYLKTNHFLTGTDATVHRTLHIEGVPGSAFSFDNQVYKMGRIDQVVKLGSTEEWTIVNNEVFGHCFHIHDVQFNLVARSSGTVADYERGWKDTVYIPRGETISIVAKFEDFASREDAYMYHCHMSNHEDGGLMGEFLVVDPSDKTSIRFRAHVDHPLTDSIKKAAESLVGKPANLGSLSHLNPKSLNTPTLLFFIDPQCRCSKDETPYLNHIALAYGQRCKVVGLLEGDARQVARWKDQVKPNFAVLLDRLQNKARSMGVATGATAVLVGPDGKVVKVSPGYDRAELDGLTQTIATLTHSSVPRIDFRSAPERLVVGSSLPNFAMAKN